MHRKGHASLSPRVKAQIQQGGGSAPPLEYRPQGVRVRLGAGSGQFISSDSTPTSQHLDKSRADRYPLMMRHILVTALIAILMFVTGFWAGQMTSPFALLSNPALTDFRGPLPGSGDGSLAPQAALSDQDIKRLTEEWLEPSANGDPAQELVRTLSDWGGNPQAVVEGVIDSMSDDQISALLTSLTSLDREALDDVYDVRAYANRMAELALGDLTGEPALRDPGLAPVYFSDSPDPQRAVDENLNEFENPNRLHAILPMDDYEGDQVFVKWTRVNDQEVMLFDRYPIRAKSDYNWVYLEPREGWPAGEYSVDFYSSDETMRPVAGGNFQVK